MSLIEAVRREFDSLMDSGEMDKAFLSWKAGDAALGSLNNLKEFLDHSDRQLSEECIAVLCRTIGKDNGSSPKRPPIKRVQGQAPGDCARVLLMWLYLPKLVEASKAVRGVNVIGTDEIEAELAAGVLEAALESSSDGMGEHLERFAINRLRRAVRRTLEYRRRWKISLSEKAEDDILATVIDALDWIPLLQIAHRRGEVSIRGMQLILLTRHDDLSIAEAAEILGIKTSLAYRDRRRAELAFVQWLGVTPSGPV